MKDLIALAKRRGFIYPGSEIYGGLANSWDYGPLGVELKNNIKNLWWKRFVQSRDDMVGIDAALIMNPKVWEASGHLEEFSDPLVECKKCKKRFRADEIGWDFSGKDSKKMLLRWPKEKKCPNCDVQINKDNFTPPRNFNLMLETFLGPTQEKANKVYFRPETAQSMFINFKNVLGTTRKTLPFGIAQIGHAFRNEITPGQFIFRTREFEIMELEYFIREEEWETHFHMWQDEMRNWMEAIGIDMGKVHEVEIDKNELAHYSKRTLDFEFEFPFGQKELYGLAYRTDFDLKAHEKASGEKLQYKDPETGEEFTPHVIEPTMGLNRSVLAVLSSAYTKEKDRTILKLKPQLAPFKAAVFPLLRNKPELVKVARKIYDDLRKDFSIAWDDRGNVGKRYYSQDEIGTPYCITVDFDSLKTEDVTIRDRDTAQQVRVPIAKLSTYLSDRISN